VAVFVSVFSFVVPGLRIRFEMIWRRPCLENREALGSTELLGGLFKRALLNPDFGFSSAWAFVPLYGRLNPGLAVIRR